MAQASPERPVKVAVLDDYQGVAESYAAWDSLPKGSGTRFFSDHIADEDKLVTQLAPFEVVVAMRERTAFPRRVLERLPQLKLLVTTGLKNAAIDLRAADERGVIVSGTESPVYPTAELTWGLILALARKIPEEDSALRQGLWQTTVGIGLQGKTLAVLGLGRQGTLVANIGKAFGMRVIAWSPNLTQERAEAAGVEFVSRSELFKQADILTVHLVLSERTRGLVGAEDFERLKRSALFVNTSRGPVVDQNALIGALHTRAIAGAALDVFDIEPLSEDHPLLSLGNTVLTPHLGYVTAETYRVFYGQALEDIQAYLRGEPVRVLRAE